MSTFAEKRTQWRGLLPYQAGLVALIGLITSAALTLANQATRDPIAASLEQDLQTSLSQVLPAGSFNNNLLTSTLVRPSPDGQRTVYVARKDSEITGLIYEVAGKGYSGTIRIVMGITPAGKILGVRVLSHTETPGLGDKIEAQKDNWINTFIGKALDTAKWGVKKDGGEFDQFAGATITPRAVVKAVHEGLQWYAQEKNAIAKETAK